MERKQFYRNHKYVTVRVVIATTIVIVIVSDVIVRDGWKNLFSFFSFELVYL